MRDIVLRLTFRNSSIFILITVLLFSCHYKTDKQRQKLPNIIFILADDLGYGDLSFTGQQLFKTPNIDSLAQEGMFFTQHYAGSTVCAPSRSSLMTGQHTGHTFIRGNVGVKPEGQYPLRSSAITVAELLQEKGYVTGAFGKWGLGPVGSEGDPNKQGFDNFYGYNCQTLAHNYYPYHLWDNHNKIMLVGNENCKKESYAPELIHQKALEFLEKNKDSTFFLFYPTTIPHAELAAPENYMTKFSEKFSPDIAYTGIDEGERYKNGGYGSQENTHAAFAAMVTLLDEQVGEITRKIEELGLTENTLIIFTSDNGPHKEGGADPDFFNSNADLQGYKRDLYEGGIRVPMIAHWPGKITANSTSDHVSAFWDFLPTVCNLVDVEAPDSIDGISYLPELLGKQQESHEYLYWEFHEQGGKQAVRMGDWKGVRLNMGEHPEAAIELYNLTEDIGEENNVANENPVIIEKIAAIMDQEHDKSEVFQFQFEQ